MADDVEQLKKHRIPPRSRSLPVLGQRPQPPPGLPKEHGTLGKRREALASNPEELREQVVDALKSVFDPEIPVNIYDLGLIYGFDIGGDGHVEISMTLTAPACPVADSLVRDVAHRVGQVPGVAHANVELVWDPPWTMDRMTEEARLELGLL